MIIKVKSLDKYDQLKSKPDKRYGYKFQGKNIHPIPTMIYWYIWGEYTFDVRSVRAKFGRKEEKKIDLDFKINPCTRFTKIAKEIEYLVGDTPFLTIFD